MLASVETLSVVVEQHVAIVDAIAEGDRDAAERALKTHLRRIFSFLGPAFAAHPDYFEQGGPAIVDPAWFDD
jgi:DNA-binding GntR family transcriptional regulator